MLGMKTEIVNVTGRTMQALHVRSIAVGGSVIVGQFISKWHHCYCNYS